MNYLRVSIVGLLFLAKPVRGEDWPGWRGPTGQGVSAVRQAEMVEAVKAATNHESWQKTLKQNRWESSWLSGPSFNGFIDVDLTTSRVMVHLLKLKA